MPWTTYRGCIRRGFVVPAICTAALAWGAAPAHAADDFDDLSVIIPVVNKALESKRSGESIPWFNPVTGKRGTVSVISTYYRADGVPCREYERTTERRESTDLIIAGIGCRVDARFWQLNEDTPRAGAAAAETTAAGAAGSEDTTTEAADDPPVSTDDAAEPSKPVEIRVAADSGAEAKAPDEVAEPRVDAEKAEQPVILTGRTPSRSDD